MSTDSRSPNLIVRFLDSFLQEHNIKWMLAVGMMLLLGSSALVVTTHWDSCAPVWKYLILLAYTAAIHGCGQWAYHRLGLRRTGTVLQGLTVLLIPTLFLLLHKDDMWVRLGLTALTLLFSVPASWRIFTHLLGRAQPTFVACYLLLAAAGAYLPVLDEMWMPLIAALLWVVFTVGTVKVNRHVFWMIEEHRHTRVFGFFPIALLGAQFLALYCRFVLPHVELEWVGFGCVLVAITVMATADAVARVFQQRCGEVLRPLPWSIVLPMLVGLILCAAGIALSATGIIPPNRPRSLVLTAAGVAGLMALVARRTRNQAFVWAMLAAATIAYNFSPAFFLDMAKHILAKGAEVVHEPRLPFAFYGLTYLPLLAVLIVGSRRFARASNELFAQPLRQYAYGLIYLLLALSLTHPKAIFPVGVCLAAISVAQVRLLRDWIAVLPAILAWIAASFGLGDFVTQVLGWPFSPDAQLTTLVAGTAILLAIGVWADGWIAKLMPPSLTADPLLKPVAENMCQFASLTVTFALVAVWLGKGTLVPENSWFTGILMIGLLCCHGLRWRDAVLSGTALVFAEVLVASIALRQALLVPELSFADIMLTTGVFGLVAFCELVNACRHNSPTRVWIAEALLGAALLYLVYYRIFVPHRGTLMFVVLFGGLVLWAVAAWARRTPRLAVLAEPMRLTAFCMPLAAVGIGILRHFANVHAAWLGANSLALFMAAGFYFWQGIEQKRRELVILAGGIVNVAFALLWRELAWTDPQFYLVPIGASVLFLVELMKAEIPEKFHNPLRYLGALVILVSPVFYIVQQGSWIHVITLMIASVTVILVAIGLRVRVLMYTGTAFLIADLIAMIVLGSIEDANVLWITGLVIGTGVIALGAYCERNREALVLRMHGLASAIKEWQ